MNLLFFDVETNGLPKVYNASYEDLENWPRVISIAWLMTDRLGNLISEQHHLIKPDGWQIPTEKFWIDNGFSQAKSMAEGVPLDGVMELFMNAKGEADTIVAHNLNFDHRIVWAEIIRSGRRPKSGMNKICTMMTTTGYCRIPKANGKGYKWPKLEELYQVLFKKSFDGAHDALADITATKDCFFELVKRGVLAVPEVLPV